MDTRSIGLNKTEGLNSDSTNFDLANTLNVPPENEVSLETLVSATFNAQSHNTFQTNVYKVIENIRKTGTAYAVLANEAINENGGFGKLWKTVNELNLCSKNSYEQEKTLEAYRKLWKVTNPKTPIWWIDLRISIIANLSQYEV